MKRKKVGELLDDKAILYFVDRDHAQSWLWFGRKVPDHKKFTATKKAKIMQKREVPRISLEIIKQDEEPNEFKEFLELFKRKKNKDWKLEFFGGGKGA